MKINPEIEKQFTELKFICDKLYQLEGIFKLIGNPNNERVCYFSREFIIGDMKTINKIFLDPIYHSTNQVMNLMVQARLDHMYKVSKDLSDIANAYKEIGNVLLSDMIGSTSIKIEECTGIISSIINGTEPIKITPEPQEVKQFPIPVKQFDKLPRAFLVVISGGHKQLEAGDVKDMIDDAYMVYYQDDDNYEQPKDILVGRIIELQN